MLRLRVLDLARTRRSNPADGIERLGYCEIAPRTRTRVQPGSAPFSRYEVKTSIQSPRIDVKTLFWSAKNDVKIESFIDLV